MTHARFAIAAIAFVSSGLLRSQPIIVSQQMKVLRGKVESCIGDFGQWVAKLSVPYERKTGMKLYPGTLNIRLANPYTIAAGSIRLEAHEFGGTVGVSIVPCRVLWRRAFILCTDANNEGTGRHPRTVVEIASDVKLRNDYNLADGDEISVEVEG